MNYITAFFLSMFIIIVLLYLIGIILNITAVISNNNKMPVKIPKGTGIILNSKWHKTFSSYKDKNIKFPYLCDIYTKHYDNNEIKFYSIGDIFINIAFYSNILYIFLFGIYIIIAV